MKKIYYFFGILIISAPIYQLYAAVLDDLAYALELLKPAPLDGPEIELTLSQKRMFRKLDADIVEAWNTILHNYARESAIIHNQVEKLIADAQAHDTYDKMRQVFHKFLNSIERPKKGKYWVLNSQQRYMIGQGGRRFVQQYWNKLSDEDRDLIISKQKIKEFMRAVENDTYEDFLQKLK
jgi:hypothetical protein